MGIMSDTYGQIKTYYHVFSPTDSDPVITKWDTNLTPEIKYYVIEKVDSKDRVVSLRFMDYNHTYSGAEAGFIPHTEYRYENNKIIETCYDEKDSLFASIEAGPPTITVYTIDSDTNIIKVTSRESKRIYSIYQGAFPVDSITASVKWQEDYYNMHTKFIYYYIYSKAKFNGKMPTVGKYNWQRETNSNYPPGSSHEFEKN